MSGNIRSFPYQGVIAHFAYFDHIVCDKPVAPVNQLQSRLTLTDTALTHNKYTDAVHVNQNTVN